MGTVRFSFLNQLIQKAYHAFVPISNFFVSRVEFEDFSILHQFQCVITSNDLGSEMDM